MRKCLSFIRKAKYERIHLIVQLKPLTVLLFGHSSKYLKSVSIHMSHLMVFRWYVLSAIRMRSHGIRNLNYSYLYGSGIYHPRLLFYWIQLESCSHVIRHISKHLNVLSLRHSTTAAVRAATSASWSHQKSTNNNRLQNSAINKLVIKDWSTRNTNADHNKILPRSALCGISETQSMSV